MMAFNLVPRRTVTEETERRDKRDLSEAATRLRKNWEATVSGLEEVAMLCARLGVQHGLDDIVAKLREPVAAPEELPPVRPPEPTVLPRNAYAPGFDWSRTDPKTALTDLELRCLLRECGVAYRDDHYERNAQGFDAQFKSLPTTQRFLRQFRERFQHYAPDAQPGSADALLLKLGYRGDFDAEAEVNVEAS
jgi:hypothetical protein